MRLRLLNESVRNRIEIIRDIFIFAKKRLDIMPHSQQ